MGSWQQSPAGSHSGSRCLVVHTRICVFIVAAAVVHSHRSTGGCAPGHGGTTCDQCQPGFYSAGGKPSNPRPVCKPCGLHFTSPPGAIGPAYCQCEAGYGATHHSEPMWQHKCDVCPKGTYNPGPGVGDRYAAVSIAAYGGGGGGGGGGKKRLPRASPCRPCNAGGDDQGYTTIDVGAKSVDQCVCAPGFGGAGCLPCSGVSSCLKQLAFG